MSPEKIREAFERYESQEEVDWAIMMALGALNRLPDAIHKLASPYSFSKLTNGLARADAIITRALILRGMEKARTRVLDGEVNTTRHWQEERRPPTNTTMHDVVDKSALELSAAKELLDLGIWDAELLGRHPDALKG